MHSFDLQIPRKVLGLRHLTPDVFVLSLERRGLRFEAGRHISLGVIPEETREYSIFSGEEDPELEVLVRRVDGGSVSRRLARLRPGDQVYLKGPKGRFLVSRSEPGSPVVLVATGTGVSPFRSFIRSKPGLDYTLIHGVRTLEEDFSKEFADPYRQVLCLSRPGGPQERTGAGALIYPGRVNQWLESSPIETSTHYFLCGNQGMLDSVGFLLAGKGVPEDHIHKEKYF